MKWEILHWGLPTRKVSFLESGLKFRFFEVIYTIWSWNYDPSDLLKY